MLASFSTAAVAAAPTNLGTFKDWSAWQGADGSGMICYISAAPTSSQPAGVNRDPVHFLVIYRKAQGVKNEVQTLVGYPLKVDGVFSAAIDGKSYSMMTTPDDAKTPTNENYGAWLSSSADEAGFVTAMKSGTNLVVKGISQRGTNTTDTYALSGVTAALAAATKACT